MILQHFFAELMKKKDGTDYEPEMYSSVLMYQLLILVWLL